MPLPLEYWQERLDRHFRSLSELRASSELPVFALEHGLSERETEEIENLLRAHLRARERLSKYWLLWVVYATEVGYRYMGDEYWQSFEEQTPGWEVHCRYSLRDWFQKFRATYGGFRPSGAWAEHFKIIAWPISHAIVPRYLQYHLLRTLYQLRFYLAGLRSVDASTVGRLLATHAHYASSRFAKFLQQEELVGRIVQGLLNEEPLDGQELIYPAALDRIISDLNRVQATRGYLKETRRAAADRFRGIGRGSPSEGISAPEGRERSTPPFTPPRLRPNLLLRYSGRGRWAVAMNVPSLAPVAALSPELRTFLGRTRCRVSGSPGTKPAGWALSSSRLTVLKSWPRPGELLLEFEQPQPILDTLLRNDWIQPSGSVWLFRVGSDGRALEIKSNIARPGRDYVLVAEHSPPSENHLLTPCEIECDGVKAFGISLSDHLSAEDTAFLGELGIQVARTVRVWPAGLPCREWDGEGQSEWLTTETPCFGFHHDHPVASFVIRLDDQTETTIKAPATGEPTFIKLSPLPAGEHRLTVRAERHTAMTDVSTGPPPEGFIDLQVREPEPWIPGVPAHAGLVVTVEPYGADLDDLWGNRVDISVLGPDSHKATFHLSLANGRGERIFLQQIGAPMQLPVRAEVWRRQLAQFLQSEDAVWRYLEAAAGKLTVSANELGEFTVHFDRDILPVRWVTRRTAGKVALRLVDDTGLASDAECRFFPMSQPLAATAPPISDLLSGTNPAEPGGLYVARHDGHQDAVIVSHGVAGQGLQGLGVSPSFHALETGTVSVASALGILQLWSRGRLAGYLADIRKGQVERELLRAIYRRLCGPNWSKAEAGFLRSPSARSIVETLRRRVGRQAGFTAVLRRDYERIAGDENQVCRWYGDLARRHGVCMDRELCDFAVRLAREPERVADIYGEKLDEMIRRAIDNPEILRGARFATLLCAHNEETKSR